jgi:hypothetical protein
MIERLAGAGNKVVVHLAMDAKTLPDADSANVSERFRLLSMTASCARQRSGSYSKS